MCGERRLFSSSKRVELGIQYLANLRSLRSSFFRAKFMGWFCMLRVATGAAGLASPSLYVPLIRVYKQISKKTHEQGNH